MSDSEDPSSSPVISHVEIPNVIARLSLRTVSAGDRMLGVVSEIRESQMDLVLSLPDGMRAKVPAHEISDDFSALLSRSLDGDALPALSSVASVGQVVCCVVREVTRTPAKTTRVVCSLRASEVNAGVDVTALPVGAPVWCSVRSVEDHGCVVTVGGTSACSAFLRIEDGDEEEEEDVAGPLSVGRPLFCSVRSKDKTGGKVILAPSESGRRTGLPKTEVTGLKGAELVTPGMLVNARVEVAEASGAAVTFLKFYAGTVARSRYPSREFKPEVKGTVRCRVLAVTKGELVSGPSVLLTMAPHLVEGHAFEFEESVAVGAKLKGCEVVAPSVVKLPGESEKTLRVAVAGEDKLEEGKKVALRVIFLNHVDGVALVSNKAEDLDDKLVVTANDLKLGQVIEGKVKAIREDKFLLVSLGGLKGSATGQLVGICPLVQFSDLKMKSFGDKVSVGDVIKCRVLQVDEELRRVVVSHKRSLLSSTLPILTSYEDAKPGTQYQGVIAKILPGCCVVAFFGDVRGVVHRAEMSRDPSDAALKQFRVGQSIKCKVLTVDPEKKKLSLTFLVSKDIPSESELAVLAEEVRGMVGSVLPGTIKEKQKEGFIVELERGEGQEPISAYLPFQHLTDHTKNVQALAALRKVGDQLPSVLILRADTRSSSLSSLTRGLTATAKPSLLRAAAALPKGVAEMQQGHAIQGYVKNLAAFGCFVGFLGDFAALAPKNQLADRFVKSPADFFDLGQSVRASVTDCDSVANPPRAVVSLKPTAAPSDDASLFLSTLLSELDEVAEIATPKKLRTVEWAKYAPGSSVACQVHEVKEYGVVARLSGEDALTGFVPQYHAQRDAEVSAGEDVRARVLDIDRTKGIVDLTFRDELVSAQAESKLPAVGSVVDVVIQLVKEQYAVVTLPKVGHRVAFASTCDYNNQKEDVFSLFKASQERKAIVLSHSTNRRILVSFVAQEKALPEKKARAEKARATKDSSTDSTGEPAKTLYEGGMRSAADLKTGMRVKGKILSVDPTQLHISLGLHVRGSVHVSHVWDPEAIVPNTHPFSGMKARQTVEAYVLGTFVRKTDPGTHGLPLTACKEHESSVTLAELSLRPSLLRPDAPVPLVEPLTFASLHRGQRVVGYVHVVTPDAIWVHLAPKVRGRVSVLDSSDDLEELRSFMDRFKQGYALPLVVTRVSAEKRKLDLSLKALSQASSDDMSDDDALEPLREGRIVPGRVFKVVPDHSVIVQIASHSYGKIDMADVDDFYRRKPLGGFKEGQFLNCYVLSVSEDKHRVALSTRKSRLGPERWAQNGRAPSKEDEAGDREEDPEISSVTQAVKGRVIRGYVSLANEKGVFVHLGRRVQGHVAVSQLGLDSQSAPTETEIKRKFPQGRLVECRVLSNNGERISLSCKTTSLQGPRDMPKTALNSVRVGDVVAVEVVRVTELGLFLQVPQTEVFGLCHVNQLVVPKRKNGRQDKEEEKIQVSKQLELYKPGDSIVVKVSRVDMEKKRVAFSMKGIDDQSRKRAREQPHEGSAGRQEGESGEAEAKRRKCVVVPPVVVDASEECAEPIAERAGFDWGEDTAEDKKAPKAKKATQPPAVKVKEEPKDDDGVTAVEDMNVDTDVKVEEIEEEEVEEDQIKEEDVEDEEEDRVKEEEEQEDEDDGLDFLDVEDEAEGDDAESDEDDASEDEEEEEGGGKMEEVKEEMNEDDEEVIARKEDELSRRKAPETAAEFERAVAEKPNSSYTWIQYMAQKLSKEDAEGARAVAERAVKAIDLREAGPERLNVWTAWLNLENRYGNPESLQEVLNRALQESDDKQVWIRVAKMFETSGKAKEAWSAHEKLLQGHKGSVKAWSRYTEWSMRSDPEAHDTRRILERALKSVAPGKHVRLVMRLAQLEYKSGSSERGRTMFEGILGQHPRRVDVWSVYLDMEISCGNVEAARQVLERVTGDSLGVTFSSKKIKFFFKRWLAMEKQFGSQSSVTRVKQRAQSYVDSHATD